MVWAESVPRVWRERVRKYRLIGGRCPSCGNVTYPHRLVCPFCGYEGLEPIELPRRGKVVTFTVIRHPPRGFEGREPYVIAIVELENGARILAQLTDVRPDEVRVGMEVEGVFRKFREQSSSGIIEYGMKFRPVI
ncbi:MAG: Zn-ribbon domain-containing OB-fold protein [Thermofilaceae archaeon]